LAHIGLLLECGFDGPRTYRVAPRRQAAINFVNQRT
jgi:hypothetical protein